MNDILKDLNIKTSKGLYREQKREVSNKFCRHLKGIDEAEFTQGHQTVSMPVCKQCGKILDKVEMKERERLLTKFKK